VRSTVTAGAAALGALGLTATLILVTAGGHPPARSVLTSNNEAINVRVADAHYSAHPTGDGSCDWTVTSNVTVVDITGAPSTADSVVASVDWGGPHGTAGYGVPATIDDAGTPPLQAGDVFQPNQPVTYGGVVTAFTIPCNATSGILRIEITDSAGTGDGAVPFLSGGQPLPVDAAGAVSGALLVGAGLAAAQRRGRRRSAASGA
jgi:hypothetical protein